MDAIIRGMIISMITSRIIKIGVAMEAFLNSFTCAPSVFNMMSLLTYFYVVLDLIDDTVESVKIFF